MPKRILFIAAIFPLLFFSGCSWNAKLKPVETAKVHPAPGNKASTTSRSLKELAEAKGRHIGVGVSAGMLFGQDVKFKGILTNQFNALTPQNELKFYSAEPKPGIYSFAKADRVIDFAVNHNMIIRGHTLIWGLGMPSWISSTKYSSTTLKWLLEDYIKTEVGRYKGKIYSWDVVNEVFNSDGSFKHNIWYDNLGPDYIKMAFEWAHEADPKAVLFINDYDIETDNPKSFAVYSFVKKLKREGVPIGGIGFQTHWDLDNRENVRDIDRNFSRFADLGLETDFTELDVCLAGFVSKQEVYDSTPNGHKILDAIIDKGLVGEVSIAKVRLRSSLYSIKSDIQKIAGNDFDKIWKVLEKTYIDSPTVNKDEKLKKQANLFGKVVSSCLGASSCKMIILWDLDDSHSWLRGSHSDDAPTAYDGDYNPKPAYYAMQRAMQ